jgi:hypothetical protein
MPRFIPHYVHVTAQVMETVFFFFLQKYGNAGNGVCRFDSTWHVAVNVTI